MTDVKILDLDTREPTDAEILSWTEMMVGPDQLLWEYDESWAHRVTTPQEKIRSYRENRQKLRGQNFPLWALVDGRVVGMIGINCYKDTPRLHSAEIGYGVAAAFARRGIGYQLLTAAIAKARQLGLKRLEAACFEDNVASIALLHKCGFQDEGTRVGAICKDGILRNERLFGLVW